MTNYRVVTCKNEKCAKPIRDVIHSGPTVERYRNPERIECPSCGTKYQYNGIDQSNGLDWKVKDLKD